MPPGLEIYNLAKVFNLKILNANESHLVIVLSQVKCMSTKSMHAVANMFINGGFLQCFSVYFTHVASFVRREIQMSETKLTGVTIPFLM